MKIIYFVGYIFPCLIGIAMSLSYTVSFGQYLSGFVVDEISFIGLQMCIKECHRKSYCYSINYNRMELLCEFSSVRKSDHMDAVAAKKWSYVVDIQTDAEVSRCHEDCTGKPSLCLSSLLSSNQDNICIPLSHVCEVTTIKNAITNNSFLGIGDTAIHQCLPEYSGKNKTQTCAIGGVLSPLTPDIKCYKQLESNSSWLLIFRAQRSLGISVYDTWYATGTSHETDPTVDTSCEGLVYSSNCSVHYRTSIIDKWGTFSVEKVRISFYKSSENGQLENRAEFDATNTDNTSWFSPQKILSSTWSTMMSNERYRVFAILGSRFREVRSFEVTSLYAGCPRDLGYFVTIDGPGGCEFDQHPTYPQFLVCLTTDKCLFQTEGSYADVMAIYVQSDFLKN